jgi:hypothetical protein
MICTINDFNAYTLTAQEECVARTPELLMAVDRWLRRKNRKEGSKFKGTIVDGEEKISNRIRSKTGTFVVHVLIERVVQCPCGRGVKHDDLAVEEIAVTMHEITATARGVITEVPQPGSAEMTVGMELDSLQDKLIDQSPCRTCGLSTWKTNEGCKYIHVA